MKYKGESTFKTLLGGIHTIAIASEILYYSLTLLEMIVTRGNTNINFVTKVDNLVLIRQNITLAEKAFIYLCMEILASLATQDISLLKRIK
mmetsp:Transcript_21641/g.24892  ORF Transcript_21641/g.24892 Transcript_21641/m.24892 type:complete len:91 (-) Transcript_21641:1354-1626(-)